MRYNRAGSAHVIDALTCTCIDVTTPASDTLIWIACISCSQAWTRDSDDMTCLQALLVNNGTASTSEMLAASLRDNAHARLIGEHSYGKGRTQRILNMKDGSTLLVSTSLVTTPTFHRIDKVDRCIISNSPQTCLKATEVPGRVDNINQRRPLLQARKCGSSVGHRSRACRAILMSLDEFVSLHQPYSLAICCRWACSRTCLQVRRLWNASKGMPA